MARFYRDVIQQTGVRDVIIWEGTNDIGYHPTLTPSQLTDAYLELIDIAHAHGIKVIGATLQPDEGAGYYTSEGNQLRGAVNNWIRTSGAFDGVADFDKVLLDPANPDQMLPAFDSGDHLHPNDVGYQAIADSINLEELTLGDHRPVGQRRAGAASRRQGDGAPGRHRDRAADDDRTGRRGQLSDHVQPRGQ